MSRTGPYLIAMTGGSGSGKSTVADALVERYQKLGIVIFAEDGYYWPMSHYGSAETKAQRQAIIARVNYDDPVSKETTLMARHLADLKAGRTIEQPIYDYDRHDRKTETLTIDPKPIIILEGIHALSVPEVKPLIDLSIYVDTPDDLRLARRLRRDVVERGRSVESVLAQYLGTVRAAHYRHTYPSMFQADLVIADEGLPAYGQVRPSEDAIDRMLAPIETRLRSEGVI
ncbi:MAG: uridine kinase [Hyphomonadaceae bacterium]|nr:uridine kinase [Hyphomonadaceae bacterium]